MRFVLRECPLVIRFVGPFVGSQALASAPRLKAHILKSLSESAFRTRRTVFQCPTAVNRFAPGGSHKSSVTRVCPCLRFADPEAGGWVSGFA